MFIRVTETIVHVIEIDEEELVVGNGANPAHFEQDELFDLAISALEKWGNDGTGEPISLRTLPDTEHPAIKRCELDTETGGYEYELDNDEYFV
mgnify:CR=1 FL=1